MEDSLYRLKSLYDNAPPWIKHWAGQAYSRVPLRMRYGKSFDEFRTLLARSERWDREVLERFQLERLVALIEHAYENVPFYRRSFDQHGVTPKSIQCLADLEKLPYLTKKDLQDDLPNLVARNYPEGARLYLTTGGSTGIPVGFYLQKGVSRSKELAFIHDQWSRVGYREGAPCAFIRGSVLQHMKEGAYWEYEPIKNHMVMSSYHITEKTAPLYLDELRRFKPEFIQAYPSALSLLASLLPKTGSTSIPGLKAILCGSENLYPGQRGLLEETFGCRVYSWYGHAERAVLGGECEHSTDYHLFPQYGIAELVDSRGRVLNEDDATGEIVATGFDNFVMPLIRYRTMDVGVRAGGVCPCGRAYPRLKRVEGRLQELIITSQGRRISMTAINMHSEVFDHVKQFQFHQAEVGQVSFHYVPTTAFSEADVSLIRRELESKLGDDMMLTLRPVNEIPRTQSGKHRFLIQEIPDTSPYTE